MRVLIVANYRINAGGISGVVINTYNNLKQEGFTVEIFNTKRNLIKRLFLLIPLIFKIRKFDIIHIHGCSHLGFYPIIIGVVASKYIFRKKTIVTFHGGGAEIFLKKHIKLVKRVLKKVDHTTVMSEFLKNVFYQYGIQTEIVPNIVNIETYNNPDINFNTPKLISIRSLNKVYNIVDIIKAFEIIKSSFLDAELKVLGTGEEEYNLKRYCKMKNITNVEFVGKISSYQVPNELKQSNILITVPTVDNQPMSILEGFASGIAIISSDVGGIPYMIKDGINGFLVKVNSPEQIADKINWIMANPEKTKEIIKNAGEELNKYKWESIRKHLLILYNN